MVEGEGRPVARGSSAIFPVLLALLLVVSAIGGCLDGDNDDDDKKKRPPPRAKVVVDKEDILEGETIEFSAEDSTGDLKDYLWEFGDGAEGSGPKVGHTYTEVGKYSIKLTVVDERGDSHSDVHYIHVHHLEEHSDAISVLQERSYVVPVQDRAQGIKVTLTYPTGSVVGGQPSNDLDIELYYPNGTLYLTSEDQDPDTGTYQVEELTVPTQEIMASFHRDWKVVVSVDTGIEVNFDLEMFVSY